MKVDKQRAGAVSGTGKDIPFNRPFIAGEELDYIRRAVENGHLSGAGPYSRQCEEWLENFLGAPRVLLTHSCTAALEAAALLTDIEPGDEVIMPSYTFVSTANAFMLRGAKPIFTDITPDTLNLDPRLIEPAITERTRALAPVHYAGVACDMDAITACAKRHDLWVVEDAAQGLHAQWHDKELGTIGDLGCLSFHETKNIISGEGGALIVNNESLMERAEIVREKGTNRSQFFRGEIDKYTWVDLGSSFLPSELTAAFLYAQLERSEQIIAKRRRLVERYAAELAPLESEGCRFPVTPEGAKHNAHMFYMICPDTEQRSELITWLREQRIQAVWHYVPLHLSPMGEKLGYARGDLPVTEDLWERLVRLPCFYGLSDDDQTRVIAAVRAFFA